LPVIDEPLSKAMTVAERALSAIPDISVACQVSLTQSAVSYLDDITAGFVCAHSESWLPWSTSADASAG